ncbi:MAG: zinc ribbon domain-containing protein [Smithellaceae bacterium]|jgi:putative FmdB family regulatory protein
MPIYEFYCTNCNTIYNFFSRAVNTGKIPVCPKCKNVKLTRQISVFAKISGGEKAEDDHSFAGRDEKKMEKELVKFANLAEKVKDDDPRAAAQLMRKFIEMTGMKLGDNFQEALQRIEKGEDPEKVEDEMGDILTQEGALNDKQATKTATKSKPKIDETLYEL